MSAPIGVPPRDDPDAWDEPEQDEAGDDGLDGPRPNVAERLLLKVAVGLFLVIMIGWGMSVLAHLLT